MSEGEMDLELFRYVNSFVGQKQLFDQFFDHIAFNYLFKGAIPIFAFWVLWFQNREKDLDHYARLLAVLATAAVATLIGRGAALLLPFKLRPAHSEGVMENIPLGNFNPPLGDWSSFPSDHAILFFALAVAFLFANRLVGFLLLVHAAFFVCLPRVYLGMHWPYDIFAGTAIGIIIAVIVAPVAFRMIRAFLDKYLYVSDGLKSFAMGVLVIFTMETATTFSATRFFLSAVFKAVKLVVT